MASPFFLYKTMNLGNAIKHIRKQAKLSQQEMAKILDVDQSYLSMLEHNKKKPSMKLLEKISEQTQFPLPVLFFLSLSEEDVPEEKRELYRIVMPNLNNMIDQIFGTSKVERDEAE